MEKRVLGLRLKQIDVAGSFCARIDDDEGYAEELADALADGAEPPPVIVFGDRAPYFMGDGRHRFRAHEIAGRLTIMADVRPGGWREAALFAVSANIRHGLRATLEDKRHAARQLLVDETWRKELTDREIARRCGLSPTTIGALWTLIKEGETVHNGQSAARKTSWEERTADHWQKWLTRIDGHASPRALEMFAAAWKVFEADLTRATTGATAGR